MDEENPGYRQGLDDGDIGEVMGEENIIVLRSAKCFFQSEQFGVGWQRAGTLIPLVLWSAGQLVDNVKLDAADLGEVVYVGLM